MALADQLTARRLLGEPTNSTVDGLIILASNFAHTSSLPMDEELDMSAGLLQWLIIDEE